MAETPVGDPPIRASAWRCCRATADLDCVCHVGGRTRGAFSSRRALAPAWGSCMGGSLHGPAGRGRVCAEAAARWPDGTPGSDRATSTVRRRVRARPQASSGPPAAGGSGGRRGVVALADACTVTPQQLTIEVLRLFELLRIDQIELRAEDVEREPLRLVVAGEKVDDGDVARLPVAVATADPLLDALRVPRQVVVDDGVAELQVQPFRPRFRRDQDRGALPELVDERQAHGHRRARRPSAVAVGVAPRVEGCPGARRVVVAPEQRDVLVAQFRLLEQEPAQVVLGRQGLGEDHHLAPVRRPVHDHAHGLHEARRLAVPRQRTGAAHEVLDPCEFVPDPLGLQWHRRHRSRSRPRPALADVVLFLEVARKLRRGRRTGIALPEHAALPRRDPVQALDERRDRRRHAPVKAEQEQPAGVAPEGLQGRRQEVVRDVVVEGALGRAHAVLEELRPPPDEGPVQTLLGLPA